MDIRLPDGRILRGVPEGTTKEQIMAKIGDVGESQKGLTITNQATPQQMANTREDANRKIYEDLTNYEQDVYARGPEAYQRMEEAQSMPFLKKAGIVAGRETDKLMAGAGDIMDFLQDATTGGSKLTGIRAYDVFNKFAQGRNKTPSERTLSRTEDQVQKDLMYTEFGENAGAANIAAMAPYLVSGSLAGPAMAKATEATIGNIAKGVNKGLTAGKGLFTKGVENIAAKPNAFQPLAQKVKKEWTDPMHLRAIAKGNQPKRGENWRTGFVGDTLGGGALGAIESGIHYDNIVPEGALAGIGGAATGRFARPFLSKRPVSYSTADQKIISDAEQLGMKFFPGGKTGDVGNQSFEAGLRSSKTWGEPLARYDRANAQAMNEQAYQAMGVPKGEVSQMTPKALRTHISNVKVEYDDLVNDSIGRFHIKGLGRMSDQLEELSKRKTPMGEEAYFAAQNMHDELLDRLVMKRDDSGKLLSAKFSGQDYQDMSRYLKDEISSAVKNGKDATVSALKDMQKGLDEAMDNGMSYGGKVSSSQWKDLNERYAMSRLLIDEGMDITGKFDPKKFGEYLMSKDAYRTLTGQGGRIKPLQKMAKANFLSRNEAGSDMTGTGFQDHGGKMSHMQGFLLDGWGKNVPLLDDTYLKAYQVGYPMRTGALGMNRKGGIWNPVTIARAQAQGNQQHPYIAEKIRNASSAIGDTANKGLMMMDESLDELDKFRMSLFN